MNNDILEGTWKQMHGKAKVWRGKLANDDPEKRDDKFDILAAYSRRSSYGYTQEQAEEKFEKRTK